MNTFVTIHVNRVQRVAATGNGLGIDVEMTADQLVAAFASYLENSNTTDAQAAAMAVAPELLAGCQAALALCERIADQYGGIKYGANFAALGASLSAAITKATGSAA